MGLTFLYLTDSEDEESITGGEPMKIERGYAEYSDKAIKRDAVKQEKPTAPQTEKTVDVQLSKQLKPFKRVPIKQPVAVSDWQN